jgi:hypothetical protein
VLLVYVPFPLLTHTLPTFVLLFLLLQGGEQGDAWQRLRGV